MHFGLVVCFPSQQSQEHKATFCREECRKQSLRCLVPRLQSFGINLLQSCLFMQFHNDLFPGSCVQSSLGSKETTFFTMFSSRGSQGIPAGTPGPPLLFPPCLPLGLFVLSLLLLSSPFRSPLSLLFPRCCHWLWGSAMLCCGLIGADGTSSVPHKLASPHKGHLPAP